MALWPVADQEQFQGSANLANSRPFVTVTASSTAHTKGAWVEVINSIGFEADGLLIAHQTQISTSATDTSLLVDVALGVSGSERVVMANVPYGHGWFTQRTFIPLRIPVGERVALRIQSAVGSKAVDMSCLVTGGPGYAGSSCGGVATTYGANTATSNGTLLTDSASANSKNTWTQIVASTTRPIRWLVPVIGLAPADTAMVLQYFLVDVGVGGSGVESVLIGNLPGMGSAGEDLRSMSSPPPIPVSLPAGVRLSGRFQQSDGSASAPTLTLIGID